MRCTSTIVIQHGSRTHNRFMEIFSLSGLHTKCKMRNKQVRQDKGVIPAMVMVKKSSSLKETEDK